MRSTASSAEAEPVVRRQSGRACADSPPMAAAELDLIAFHRFLVRAGDHGFATRVAAFLRRDPTLSRRVDRELRTTHCTRGWSPAAVRVLGSLTEQLGLEPA